MSKPIILTVDDDQDVLQAIARDLRHGFGEHFRIIRAESGERALDVLRQVKLANETVALMLVDQRMPGLSGVELLVEARRFFPDAKKALLTAYADTEAAITAINEVRLDHYLVKPWDPPEQRLFPVLDDMLDDWMADYQPTFDGIRLLGHRWSPESHVVRDFLARNQVPFHWMDVENDPGARDVLALTDNDGSACPVLVYADGTVQVTPTLQEIAEKIGLRGHAEVPVYDLIIVGAGPAGLAAAVYGASEGLNTIVIEREAAGGQAGMSSLIENYLGFPAGLSGGDLSRRAMTQARRFGAAFLLTQEVSAVHDHDGVVGVTLSDGTELRAHSVIIATGVSYRRLNAPGVDSLTGRGVYYGAATTETTSVRGEDIFIVGGANSAGQAAMHFSTVARNVTLLVRGSALSASMSHYLSERIENTPNIHVRYHTEVGEVTGTDHLETIVLRDTVNGDTETVPAAALFVFIGAQPHTEWLDGQVARDDKGFILTGLDAANATPRTGRLGRDPYLLETSVPGVFAAGDVRHGSGKRVATAVGEGATAVISVWQHRARVGL
ncbi:MAG TPA: FAD-dependent oxidoreductase [Thermomicrobiales bacterium]|nr:FAD-dependent oxidoreductase [Thermomicrobiales bacterium]